MIITAKKKCYIPTLSIRGNNTLDFALYQTDMPIQKNRYRITEPMFAKKIAVDLLDIVIFPLVGFDMNGHRLGMGGGYYDRTFHSIKQKKTTPFFLGLGYECQKVDTLPKDAWDVCLQGVLTEREIYYFKK